MGEEGPKGDMGEKVSKFFIFTFCVYVLDPAQRNSRVWLWLEDIKKKKKKLMFAI